VAGVVTELKGQGRRQGGGRRAGPGRVKSSADGAATGSGSLAANAPATPVRQQHRFRPLPRFRLSPQLAGPVPPTTARRSRLITAPAARITMPTPAERLTGGARPRQPLGAPSPANSASMSASVTGTGPKGRITQADVQAFVKGFIGGAAPGAVAPAGTGTGLDLLPWPKVDFAKFGAIEVRPLSRIKKISGANLSRNWVDDPGRHQFDEDADITDLEAFRVQINKENEKSGTKSASKLTMLAFLIKACVKALKKFPEFNASLEWR
jgi:pyruvate dehydrogenase E2 component (dihydrolipoamide acetyltransferase)